MAVNLWIYFLYWNLHEKSGFFEGHVVTFTSQQIHWWSKCWSSLSASFGILALNLIFFILKTYKQFLNLLCMCIVYLSLFQQSKFKDKKIPRKKQNCDVRFQLFEYNLVQKRFSTWLHAVFVNYWSLKNLFSWKKSTLVHSAQWRSHRVECGSGENNKLREYHHDNHKITILWEKITSLFQDAKKV